MPGKIVILDENTSNQIAAGEVIERPASVLKELIENSMDAGATRIEVEISKGGISYIRVSDNGEGILPDDVPLAFERHGTSKIRRAEDLQEVATMGFRGEALASVASVSRVSLTTRTCGHSHGVRYQIEGGIRPTFSSYPRSVGTTVEVRDLFYNIPARYKFLKNDATEGRYCTEAVTRLALSRPGISFRLVSNGQEQLLTPGDSSLLSAVYAIFGKETAALLVPVQDSFEDICVQGLAGTPALSRGNRQHQMIFLNGRYIRSSDITHACEQAYETLLERGRFSFFILYITLPRARVDVNVHPSKIEVRFRDVKPVFQAVFQGMQKALRTRQPIQQARIPFQPTNHTSVWKNAHETFEEGGRRIKETMEQYVVPGVRPDLEKRESDRGEDQEKIGPFTVLGQIFGTYLLLQRDRDVLVVDQHAAHERILYEEMLDDYGKDGITVQMLFVPVQVQLSAAEMDKLEDNRELLTSLGFDFDLFGSSAVLLRGIPQRIGETAHAGDTFRTLLNGISPIGKTKPEGVDGESLYQLACIAAVKANQNLSAEEMEGLVRRLDQLDSPFTCPHGRPVILKINKTDFEKMFRRTK